MSKMNWLEEAETSPTFCFNCDCILAVCTPNCVHNRMSNSAQIHISNQALTNTNTNKHHHDWNAHNSLFELIDAAWYGL